MEDINARITFWEDIRSNEYELGKSFSFAVVWALLYHLRTNLHLFPAISKVEVLLTCVCNFSVCHLFSDAFFVKEVDLFTGEPSVGHWPTCYEVNITKPLNLSEVRHELTLLNWDILTSVLEVDDRETFGVSIKQFLSQFLQSINKRIGVYQFIPSKNVSTHSKPYWNAKLSGLTLEIQVCRRKLKLKKIRLIKQSCLILSRE